MAGILVDKVFPLHLHHNVSGERLEISDDLLNTGIR
jgi:hypothetical protein